MAEKTIKAVEAKQTEQKEPVMTHASKKTIQFDVGRLWFGLGGFVAGVLLTLLLGSLWVHLIGNSWGDRYYDRQMPRMMQDNRYF